MPQETVSIEERVVKGMIMGERIAIFPIDQEVMFIEVLSIAEMTPPYAMILLMTEDFAVNLAVTFLPQIIADQDLIIAVALEIH